MMEIGNLIAARNTAVDARRDENKLDDGFDAPAAVSPTAASMPTTSTASTGPGLQRPRGMRRLEGPNSRVWRRDLILAGSACTLAWSNCKDKRLSYTARRGMGWDGMGAPYVPQVCLSLENRGHRGSSVQAVSSRGRVAVCSMSPSFGRGASRKLL
jgi:hypothetical protein